MTNKYSDGNTILYTNSGTTTITAGTCVVENDIAGFAINDIAAGATGPLDISRSVFSATAAAGAWLQGQNLYVTSTGTWTTASTGNVLAGKAAAAKATADTTGYVLLTNQS